MYQNALYMCELGNPKKQKTKHTYREQKKYERQWYISTQL